MDILAKQIADIDKKKVEIMRQLELKKAQQLLRKSDDNLRLSSTMSFLSRTNSISSETSSKKSWFELSIDDDSSPIANEPTIKYEPAPKFHTIIIPTISQCSKCLAKIIVKPANGSATYAPIEENGNVHLCHTLPCVSKICQDCGLNFHLIGSGKAIITDKEWKIVIGDDGKAVPHNRGTCKTDLARYIQS